LIGLGAASISESELTHGLLSLLSPLTRVGIPAADFVLAVQVSLRYFPLLAQSAERIAKAQASRGADWRPAGWNLVRRAQQIIPLVVPLFITSLRRAENMALAMDARGYGSQPVRTSLVTLRFTPRDALALAAVLALAVVMVFL
jgi:energy-coupling factor transport system permease protein